MIGAFLALQSLPARAISLIRDPDIEYALGRLASPILKAAGLGNIRILLVNDPKLNAFVVDNRHIFLNTGLVMRMETPEMLQAVIAHEAAHIANGHLSRRRQNYGNARTVAGLGIALAAAAAVASDNPQLGAGVALGIQSASQRAFFAHTREEEASADRTAISYLAQSGINTQGVIDVFELFRGQELLKTNRQDAYARTHPLTRDRLRAAKAMAKAYAKGGQPADQNATYWFKRAQGKLSAFLRSPKWTRGDLKNSPSQDVLLMREAIMHHRQSNTKKALANIDKAIAMRPKDPYFRELKGQILIESRNVKASVGVYKQAVNLAPNNSLILGSYGRALLASGQPKSALRVLEKARSIDFRDSRILRDLGGAYAQTGNPGMAAVATAERYALQGRMKDAGIQAKRALGLLPQGSSGWRRADDILLAANRAAKKRK